MDPGRLQVLLLNERGPWVAISLQHYIVAQGNSPSDAVQTLRWTYWTQVLLDKEKGVQPLSQIEKAPEEYWKSYASGIPLAMKADFTPPFSLDDVPAVPEDVRLADAA